MDSGQPFQFICPVLESGEYLTDISIRFETVNEDFGVGDEIVFTFKAADSVNEGDVIRNVAKNSFEYMGTKYEYESVSLSGIAGKINPTTGDNVALAVPRWELTRWHCWRELR